MKILELHYTTSWAGAERFVVDLCNELIHKDRVVLCTIEDDRVDNKGFYKKELNPDIEYVNLRCQSGLQLKALWRIYRTIKTLKPDVVHAHTDCICLWLVALLCTKVRYFHTLHNLARVCVRQHWLIPLYRWFYKTRIQPITISKVCHESYKELYELNNAVRIDNGRSALSPSEAFGDVSQEIEKMKLHLDDKVFVHVARCSVQKNQAMLIEAFNKFLSEGNHGILIIVGTGYDLSENRAILAAAKLGIYWVGLKNNVCDYLMNADFFVLTSLWEGLPISLLEALSVGVIPVCTPAGGIPDVINQKDIGFVSPDFSINTFYPTLLEAYQSSDSFDRDTLKRYFEKNFSMCECGNRYYNVFLEHS